MLLKGVAKTKYDAINTNATQVSFLNNSTENKFIPQSFTAAGWITKVKSRSAIPKILL